VETLSIIMSISSGIALGGVIFVVILRRARILSSFRRSAEDIQLVAFMIIAMSLGVLALALIQYLLQG
jgi:hypothetical protein